MPITLNTHVGELAGSVNAEDAATLAQWLQETPDATVDLRSCEHLHTAALQALLVWRPKLAGTPTNPLLATLLTQHLGVA